MEGLSYSALSAIVCNIAGAFHDSSSAHLNCKHGLCFSTSTLLKQNVNCSSVNDHIEQSNQ